MAFKEIKVQEEVAANLVPMIDIMFLLLLFFMLNADMSQRELEELTPPVANQAQEDKPDENTDRITLNVFHNNPDCAAHAAKDICREEAHWAISVGGQPYQLTKAGLEDLERRLSALADTRRVPGDPAKKSERHVLIRADRSAPYGYVQRSLERCSMAGLYRVEVAAQIEKSSVDKK